MDRWARAQAEGRLEASSILGVFNLAMARQAGFTRSAIRRRINAGAWVPVAGAAYRDAGLAMGGGLEGHRRAVAAGLTWHGAIACLRTAALVHGLPIEDDGVTHAIVVDGRRHGRGLVSHRYSVDLPDIVRGRGYLVTSMERTVADCLMLLPPREAGGLLAWIRTRELLSVNALEDLLEIRYARRGVRQMRRLVGWSSGGALSRLEELLHTLLRDDGLTGWAANEPIIVRGQIVARGDVVFRSHKLIVEVDGKDFHGDFERDRERLNTLALAGYTVLHFTWQQVTAEPGTVIRQIRAALSRPMAA